MKGGVLIVATTLAFGLASSVSCRVLADAAPDCIIIAPKDLAPLWQAVYADTVPAINGKTYAVVSTETIYRDHPYDAAHADGRPRNPAESIHAFIASRAAATGHFILGGPWVDVADLATNRVMKLATGERLTRDNTVPGVKICPDARYCSPTDMYYACLDAGNAYAWDANGDGVYLDAASFAQSDLTANVVVSRVPLVTWSDWKHPDGTLYTQAELLAAYVDKLRRGLADDFGGATRYGIYGYLINESGAQRLGGPSEPWVERGETAFYDGGYNMFDPARGTDEFWLVEGVSRRHVRDQIARTRPIDDVNGFLETTFSCSHADRDAARVAWTTEDYALRFYYAHGARGGGHGFGMNDYAQPGCGLTLFDDCAGPCSTGRIEFDAQGVYQMNYAIACVMSPFGGSLATVNNSDFGIADLNNYWKTFTPNDSWRYANNYLVGFVQSNLTVGVAWRYNVTDFVTNYKYNKSGLDTWMLAEEMLLGDPFVRLPAVADGLPYGVDGVTYRGLPGKTDAVVSLAVSGDLVLNTPTVPFKVTDRLETDGTSLTLCTAAGGVGGQGIVFTGAKGDLTLAGDAPFYVAGVKNANRVTIQGTGATLEFDATELPADVPSALYVASGSDATIRSRTEGAFARLKDRELDLPRNGTVRLSTWNAFGATKGILSAQAGSKLVIAANPFYHDGRDRGEALNATVSLGYKATLDVRVARGGLFTPQDPLVGNASVTYQVEARDGLGGTVTVPDKATLTLGELPLTKVAQLTVARGGTLVLPTGKTVDDLVSSGRATLKAGAKVTCDGVTTTVSEERTIEGADYVQRYYYGTATNWEPGTKVALERSGALTETATSGDIVVFASGGRFPATGNLYIKQTEARTVEVADGTELHVGAGYSAVTGLNGRSFTDGWHVTVAADSALHVSGWGYAEDAPGGTRARTYGMDGTVTFDGDGRVVFSAEDARTYVVENIRGTATILIPAGVTVTCTGTVANAITVPEGYELLKRVQDGVTVYSAIRPRTIYWDSTAKEEWSASKGAPDFTDADGNAVTYEPGDTVCVRKTSSGILWLGAVADGVPFVIDGCALQIENEGDSRTVFCGSEVSLVNGASLAYRSRWNGVTLKDTTIRLEAGTSFGQHAQWGVVVDIEGQVVFDGAGDISFGSGARLATVTAQLVVPLRTPAIAVTCAVAGYCVGSRAEGDQMVYYAEPEEIVVDPRAMQELPVGTDPAKVRVKCGDFDLTSAGCVTVSTDNDGVIVISVNEQARPVIGGIVLGEGGLSPAVSVRLEVTVPGLEYTLESSPDLGTWSTEAALRATGASPLVLPASWNGAPSRFFRVVVGF